MPAEPPAAESPAAGSPAAESPAAESPRRTVAAFDFDGTLTRRDTLLPFLVQLCGPSRVAWALASEAPVLASVALGRGDRDAGKARLLARVLAGLPMAAVQAVVDSYAADVTARRLRPDTVTRLRWHVRNGHDVVVVSASPELYVAPIVRRLGVLTVLATGLEVDAADRLTGRLLGANVRGPEKERRLREHLGSEPVTLYAYGDSTGDRELLAMADVGLQVRRVVVPHRP